MALINNNLYLYDTVIELSYTESIGYELDNRPMNTREFKVHKGVENTLYFRISDRDRRKQNVYTHRIVATVIDPVKRKRLLRKDCVSELGQGEIKLILSPADLRDIQSGFYEMFVTITPEGGVEQPLYSNQNNDLKFDLEITNQSYTNPVPTQVSNEFFLAYVTPEDANVYVSEVFSGNSEHNYTNPQHSIAVYTDGYTGNLTVQTSLLPNSPSSTYPNSEWSDLFTVALSDANTIQHFTFLTNANWIRVVNIPDVGSNAGAVTQILLRN